jgi:hypothetical protein
MSFWNDKFDLTQKIGYPLQVLILFIMWLIVRPIINKKSETGGKK